MSNSDGKWPEFQPKKGPNLGSGGRRRENEIEKNQEILARFLNFSTTGLVGGCGGKSGWKAGVVAVRLSSEPWPMAARGGDGGLRKL
ncbi:unnamed protein product [Prunus armeniaca]